MFWIPSNYQDHCKNNLIKDIKSDLGEPIVEQYIYNTNHILQWIKKTSQGIKTNFYIPWLNLIFVSLNCVCVKETHNTVNVCAWMFKTL